MNPLNKLAKETLLYGITSILGRILNYVLVPFYTGLLLPAEYGIVTELYAYAAFLNVVFSYGLETAYLRLATLQPNRTILGETMGLLLISSLLLSATLVGLANPISLWLGYPQQAYYIHWLVAIVMTDTFLVLPFAQLRLDHQAIRFTVVKWVQIILQMGLNIWFLWITPILAASGLINPDSPLAWLIYSPSDPVVCILTANLVANLCIVCWLGGMWRSCRLPRHWSTLQGLLHYALPLLIMGLAGMVNEMLSRALLRHLLPPNFYPPFSNETIIGTFGACYKLAIFMSLAIQAFRYAADPFFFKHANEASCGPLFGKVMQAYVVVGCFIWLAVSINLDLLGQLFLRQAVYWHCLDMVPYLTFGYFLLGIYYNLSIWFKLTHLTHYGALLTGLGAFVTVALNWLLVPHWGYWGAVWANLASYACMVVGCYWQGQRHYPISYQLKEGVTTVAITLLLLIALKKIRYPSWYTGIILNLVWTFLIGATILVVGYCQYQKQNQSYKP